METVVTSVNKESANLADGNTSLKMLFVALSRIVADDELQLSLTEAISYCDQLSRRKDSSLDPRLLHYLERRSYAKAHRFVQDIL
jgi:hypothetical protein